MTFFFLIMKKPKSSLDRGPLQQSQYWRNPKCKFLHKSNKNIKPWIELEDDRTWYNFYDTNFLSYVQENVTASFCLSYVAYSIAFDLLMPSEAKLLIYVQFHDSGIRASPANTTVLGDCY